MLEHILTKGCIQGRFTNIRVYRLYYSSYEYLVSWNVKEAGVSKRIDNKWYGETEELVAVVE